MPKEPFTVLLLRPDFITNDYGQELQGQEQASAADHGEGDDKVPPADYHVLMVIHDHCADVKS